MLDAAALLLLALLAARYVTPFWLFFTFASFQIQGAVIAGVAALLAFLFHRNIISALIILASLAVGIHGYLMLGDFVQAPNKQANSGPVIHMLDLNIMGDNSRANGKSIADYMISSGADVIFIQESAPIGPDIDRIKVVYPYRLGCGAQTITCDQSLWSKYPLEAAKVQTASPVYRDRLMHAMIDFGGTKVTFINAHLTKPYFDIFHVLELKQISNIANQQQGPLVLAGDFNASILTPDVRWFLGWTRLRTAEREPQTWPVGAPQIGMAIDHLLVRDGLYIKSLERVPDARGSNHYGLKAEIQILPKQ
jgi:endonuclease/exonuclease/phosphatase (EEP) superfamily protein YafD